MASVASGGTADRIAGRTLFKVLRAGSGTPARYSSTFFGATFLFAAELRSPAFAFFIQAILQGRSPQIHVSRYHAPVRREKRRSAYRFIGPDGCDSTMLAN